MIPTLTTCNFSSIYSEWSPHNNMIDGNTLTTIQLEFQLFKIFFFWFLLWRFKFIFKWISIVGWLPRYLRLTVMKCGHSKLWSTLEVRRRWKVCSINISDVFRWLEDKCPVGRFLLALAEDPSGPLVTIRQNRHERGGNAALIVMNFRVFWYSKQLKTYGGN